MIKGILANCTVTDLARAEEWYTVLFGREPDHRPMPGLLEWHLGVGYGVQVWSEPDRAGNSTIVLDESDLDAEAARLLETGIAHQGPQLGGGAHILQLEDPDGNRVVLAGALVIPLP
ncbi:VOC family protein [Glutamicibacter sp. 287]|uniref:VOC family protein n=1 Tax=unclassified Glutamicibacter TaxID=2627139 RepID=UPI000BB9A70A|nr:VOC family protein [Glutamicibacter sp. BW80]PCC29832.1 glyoxalase [Glutamicibacter sp. BW80]